MWEPLKILIIDANQNFARAAKQHLCRLDNIDAVDLAVDLQEARQQFRRHPYQLFILDLALTVGQSQSLKEEVPHSKIIGLYLFDDDLTFFKYPGTFHCDVLVSRKNFGDTVTQMLQSLFPYQRGDADT